MDATEEIIRATKAGKTQIERIPEDFRQQIIRVQKANSQQSQLSTAACAIIVLSSVFQNQVLSIFLFLVAAGCIAAAFALARRSSIADKV